MKGDLGLEHDAGRIQIYVLQACVLPSVPLFQEELTESPSPDILKLLAAL